MNFNLLCSYCDLDFILYTGINTRMFGSLVYKTINRAISANQRGQFSEILLINLSRAKMCHYSASKTSVNFCCEQC